MFGQAGLRRRDSLAHSAGGGKQPRAGGSSSTRERGRRVDRMTLVTTVRNTAFEPSNILINLTLVQPAVVDNLIENRQNRCLREPE